MLWSRLSERRFDLADIRRKKELGERRAEERRRKEVRGRVASRRAVGGEATAAW